MEVYQSESTVKIKVRIARQQDLLWKCSLEPGQRVTMTCQWVPCCFYQVTASCVWGFTDPENGEGIGWTDAEVCFHPDTRTGYVRSLPDTQEFHRYSEWE